MSRVLIKRLTETRDNSALSILQVGKYYPPQWGGIETVTRNLAVGLSEAGIENSVLAFGNKRESFRTSSGRNASRVFRRHCTEIKGAPVGLGYLVTLFKQARNHNILLIHLPNPFAMVALLLSRYRRKVVLYWHSDIVNKGILGLVLRPLERWIIRRADNILAPTSQHFKHSYYSKLFSKKQSVVPYPVDKSLQTAASQRIVVEKQLPVGREVTILAIGRLVEYKGFRYLLEAIPLIQEKTKVRLELVGTGPLLDGLIELAESLSIKDAVTFHGAVTSKVLEELLSRSDVFCLPSISKAEMFGMVQLEAMAYGLPIISTEIPGSGVAEITRLSGAGISVLPKSAEALAVAVNQLLSDENNYRRFSLAGKLAIKEVFSQEETINCLVKTLVN